LLLRSRLLVSWCDVACGHFLARWQIAPHWLWHIGHACMMPCRTGAGKVAEFPQKSIAAGRAPV